MISTEEQSILISNCLKVELMILDTTLLTEDVVRKINALVGASYPVMKRLRMGGTGSRRMELVSASPQFAHFLADNSDTVYANIELREKGILLHFKKYQTRYSWLIPYHQLVIFKSDTFSIHSAGQNMRFHAEKMDELNSRFVTRMLEIKAQYLGDSIDQ